ncbi:hypothetical protein [Paraburkholderia sp. SIMBA_027]|uniref:hypothetical protein n=1 Tax=Paraburkholderia sp. SIMBA_027 TaxID=3085770 RepID=UPI00397A863A
MSYGEKFIVRLHTKAAFGAIGRSTLRSQGAPGMVDCARRFLASSVAIGDFNVESEAQFGKMLDRYTKRLANSFPDAGKGNWGAARKALNIFLRDVVYNRTLSDHYGVEHIHEWLELPMDRHCYDGLARLASEKVGVWPKIKYLKPHENVYFQNVASEVAKQESIFRVDLDIVFWQSEKLDELLKRSP